MNKKITEGSGSFHAVINRGNLLYCLDQARKTDNIEELAREASRLLVCLARSHAFFDGNKRTAYELTRIYIEKNGYTLEPVEPRDVVNLFTKVAEGKFSASKVGFWIRKLLRKD